MAKKKIKARKYAPGGSLAALADTSGMTSIPNLGGPQRTPLNIGRALGGLSGGLGGIANGVASTISGLINPSGNSTGVGNVMQGIGSIASNIPGVGGIIGAGVNMLGGLVNAAFGSNINEEFVNQTKQSAAQQSNYVSEATDNSSLLSDWSSHQDMSHVSQDEVGSDGWFSNKAKNLTKKLNRQIDQANFRAWSSLDNTAANVDANNDLNIMSNFAAEGGPLFTHGGIWDNGLTYINEGGSHEENPFEGIQMGVDNQGIPNLVEEGEVVYNDYVFSNRLTIPKDLKKKYKIKGKTYADAAKYMSKESEERPNDSISQRGLDASMNILTNSQEEMRNRKNNNKYSHGGELGNLFDGLGKGSQNLKSYSNFTRLNNDDFYTPEYMDFWNWYNNNSNTDEGRKWLQRINSGEFGQIGGNTFNAADISRLAHDYKKGPVHNAFSEAAKQFNKERKTIKPFAPFGINDAVDTEALKGLEVPLRTSSKTSENSKGKEEVEEDKGNPLTWLRYAPVLGSAVGLGYDLFSKPDYSSADAVLEAANDTGNYMPVQANPIGNYLAYRPFDRMFYINQLNANNAAGRRAIQNTSGGNRAAAMAGILASDYNYGNSLGNLARQAEEYNLAQRERVENFNRGTNMFNSEQDLKAQMANQSALARARAARLSGVAQAMAMRDAIDNRRSASLSANFTNLFDSLGNIGREEVMKDWINDNPALYYDISTGGRGLGYKGNGTRAKGGYITIKNKKRRK